MIEMLTIINGGGVKLSLYKKVKVSDRKKGGRAC